MFGRDGVATGLARASACSLREAQQACRDLTRRHYENFPVLSALLPPRLRQDFCNVYAFCRVADDLADEAATPDEASVGLAEWRRQTHACYAGEAQSPVFVALRDTIQRHSLAIDPLLDLIDAFEQDQRITRYSTWDELLDYCRRSANPVGRMVLCMCGCDDQQRRGLSDQICTALQLVNFWQDVRNDLLVRNRIYIPRELMDQYGVTEDQLRAGRCDDNYRDMLRDAADRTEKLFDEGEQLLPLLSTEVRSHVGLFSAGGRAVLAAIRRQDYDTLSQRPVLSRTAKLRLVFRAATAWARGCLGRRPA